MWSEKTSREYPEFLEFVNDYDLLLFSETKIDDTDIISFPGFSCFAQPRKSRTLRRSGGISIYFRDKYAKYIKKLSPNQTIFYGLKLINPYCVKINV